MGLALHNPKSLVTVDPIEKRAGDLLRRVGLRLETHIGQIFLHLYRAAGGGPGVVDGVTGHEIADSVGCSDSSVRKSMPILEERRLVSLVKSPNRFLPWTVHVLSFGADPQGVFDFARADSQEQVCLRVTGCAPMRERCAPVRTYAGKVRTDVGIEPEIATEEKTSSPEVETRSQDRPTVEPETPPSYDQSARDVRRARQSNPRDSNNYLQSQSKERSTTPKDQAPRPALPAPPPARTSDDGPRRLAPEPIGGVVADVVAAAVRTAAAAIALDRNELGRRVLRLVPGLSRRWVSAACERAIPPSRVDGHEVWDASRLLQEAQEIAADPNVDNSAAVMHSRLREAFTRREWPLPVAARKAVLL